MSPMELAKVRKHSDKYLKQGLDQGQHLSYMEPPFFLLRKKIEC